MKKNWIYLFLSMAIVAPLASCSNDDDEPKPVVGQHDHTSDDDQKPIEAYDALEWLQGSLVLVDENGEVVRRVYGKPLDESQPTVISIPVKNAAAAVQKFLTWVAPDKEPIGIDGGYDYPLTDAQGNAQGSVSFRLLEDKGGVIARMTVEPGTDLKQVTEVNFVDAEAWPENDTEKYTAGKTYWLDAERYLWIQYRDDLYNGDFRLINEKLEFYCLQGNDQGYNDAILVWLSPDDSPSDWQTVSGRDQWLMTHTYPYNYLYYGLNYRLPHLCELLQVMNFYYSNRSAWNEMLKVMDGKGYQWSAGTGKNATRTSEFVFGGNEGQLLLLDLDEAVPTLGTVDKHSFNMYRYMQVRIVSWR